jgi:hypothetical protein
VWRRSAARGGTRLVESGGCFAAADEYDFAIEQIAENIGVEIGLLCGVELGVHGGHLS